MSNLSNTSPLVSAPPQCEMKTKPETGAGRGRGRGRGSAAWTRHSCGLTRGNEWPELRSWTRVTCLHPPPLHPPALVANTLFARRSGPAEKYNQTKSRFFNANRIRSQNLTFICTAFSGIFWYLGISWVSLVRSASDVAHTAGWDIGDYNLNTNHFVSSVFSILHRKHDPRRIATIRQSTPVWPVNISTDIYCLVMFTISAAYLQSKCCIHRRYFHRQICFTFHLCNSRQRLDSMFKFMFSVYQCRSRGSKSAES